MNNNGQSAMERLRGLQPAAKATAGKSDFETTTTTTKEQVMSDQLSMTAVLQKMHELETKLAAAGAAASVPAPTMAPVQPPAFLFPGAPQPQASSVAMPQATGVAVQIEIETASGKATAFLNYGPEWAASSAAMKQLIGALQMAGFPVKAWVPKGQRGGGW